MVDVGAIVIAIAIVALGLKGFSPTGLPLTGTKSITGAPAKIIGAICIAVGLAAFAFALGVWILREMYTKYVPGPIRILGVRRFVLKPCAPGSSGHGAEAQRWNLIGCQGLVLQAVFVGVWSTRDREGYCAEPPPRPAPGIPVEGKWVSQMLSQQKIGAGIAVEGKWGLLLSVRIVCFAAQSEEQGTERWGVGRRVRGRRC